MKSKSLIAVATMVSIAMVVTGCSMGPASGDGGGDKALLGKVVSTAPARGNSDEWVKWDSSKCLFAKATEHPKTWKPEIRKVTDSLTIGFGAQDTTHEVNVKMNDSMSNAIKKAGAKEAFADYKWPNKSDTISGARSIAARKPAVVVSNNQDNSLLDSVNAIFKKDCIPVVQVVTKSKGTVLFGPNNADMGKLQAKRLIAYAKAKKWSPDSLTLMSTYYPPAGPDVNARAKSCAEAVQKEYPGITSVKGETKTTTSLDLQNDFTNLLTAHPEAEHILVCTVADLWAVADATALKLAGRQADAAVTGVNGESTVLDTIKKGNTALVGSVDLGADSWGDYWVPMAEDIAAGNPVPSQVYAPIKMLPAELPLGK